MGVFEDHVKNERPSTVVGLGKFQQTKWKQSLLDIKEERASQMKEYNSKEQETLQKNQARHDATKNGTHNSSNQNLKLKNKNPSWNTFLGKKSSAQLKGQADEINL